MFSGLLDAGAKVKAVKRATFEYLVLSPSLSSTGVVTVSSAAGVVTGAQRIASRCSPFHVLEEVEEVLFLLSVPRRGHSVLKV